MSRVVVIWWGAGTFNVLYWLKQNPEFDISAIISVADSGGTAGLIRDKYGILPPGDFRRAIAALAKDTHLVRQLFEYSFHGEEGVIGCNKIGNILLTALVDLSGGDFEQAINTLSDMFGVRGHVIPVTIEDVQLAVRFEDGTVVHGEKNIDVSEKNDFVREHNIDQNIVEAWLEGNPGTLNPHARDAILAADSIIIGPGDLYTSIVPNLLCQGMREALASTDAKIIYICNAMTKRWETTNMEVIDFIETIERYIDPGQLNSVIVNNGIIPDEIVTKYKAEESKNPLRIKDPSLFVGKGYQIIERDLVHTGGDYVRHDPEQLMEVLEEIMRGQE